MNFEKVGRMEELKKKVSYMVYGVAALAILLVFSSVYFFTQISTLDNKITQTLFDQNLQLQARLTQLETKVGALEQLNPLKYATLSLYYDSSCASCKNGALLAGMENFTRAMAATNNVQVEVTDVAKGTVAPMGKLPSFYAARTDVANNKGLVDVLNDFVQNGGYQLVQMQDGVAVIMPGYTELVNSGCRNAKPRVDAFYDGSSIIAAQGVANAKDYAAEKGGIDFRMRCYGSDNATQQKCAQDIGPANYTESQQLYSEYMINADANARFVVDCKYEFPALSADEFEAGLCLVRPDACANSTAA
ncbi:hypothetical protein COU39_03030 [Candidatus Micrarchaeota archaeon CG10_big_fil_rev_8_21_14_0_10_60_32]|nr:MAG: hypothetical protein COU39_03030 [Candidatus Micrarchaeota archaeon CG10_big_fil_rev_8_21_14_0_10_60_32]PIO02056.1 MAG: hypothetical protein COT58_01930 [Candidatus Micrarchaeota archaeon CG09_land_8_20_14_0_10_60_16]PIY91617.1 MAG: hypothetical protein COY71_02230 [Candidatus Micrarchaeota archaeon CG_4_10_14_0_8_um_filter_60_7]